MRGFLGFTKRNILIYFKDIQAVIFSLLTSIIVFALYLLFLKKSFVETFEASIVGLEDIISSADIDMLVNALLLTGILGSALITVSYNCLSTIVNDREKRIDYDISATPLKRWQIILAYFVSATICAVIMSAIILTIGLIALSNMGDLNMGAKDILMAYGIVFLGAISATAFFMIVVMFFKTSSSSGAFFGILSAAAGFVIGAYIPIAQFSSSVQTVCNIFPASHVTIIIRNILMNGVLEKIDQDINGLDNGAFVDGIKSSFGFSAKLFDNSLSMDKMLLYIGATTVLCIFVMIIVYTRTYKRK